MNACQFTSQLHHSDDLIAVFHGVGSPTILCGYHTTEAWLSDAIAYANRPTVSLVKPVSFAKRDRTSAYLPMGW